MRIFSAQFLMQQKSPYKFVEYLESTGTQYIDTGVSNMDVFGYEIEYQSTGIVKSSASYNFDGVFGTNGTGTNTDIKLWFNYADQSAIYNSIYCKCAYIFSDKLDINQYYQNKHKVSVKNKVIEWDGKTLGQIENFNTPTKKATIHLFGVNNAGTSSMYRSKTRIYSLKLYDADDKLIADFRPCVRIEDNKPGMYDTVTKRFLINSGASQYEFRVGE